MRKSLLISTILGLALLSSTALAHEENRFFKGQGEIGLLKHLKAESSTEADVDIRVEDSDDEGEDSNVSSSGFLQNKLFSFHEGEFTFVGKVTAESNNSLTVDLVGQRPVIIVAINAETEIQTRGDEEADIKVGDMVLVKGELQDEAYIAEEIKILGPKNHHKAFGEITSTTDNSVTIKNNVTGEVQTVAITPDTKVRINGEVKTVSDIQAGDTGWIRFKAKISSMIAGMINLFR